MNAIKMKRQDLLDIVIHNRAKHATAYTEAVTDYKSLVLKVAAENLKIAKSGDLETFKKMRSMPSAPVQYSESYHRAIRMLELSVEDIIEVEEDVFNQLVLDEWGWKNHFIATSSSYKI